MSAEGPTADPLFNDLHAWWKSRGGACKNVGFAWQQMRSLPVLKDGTVTSAGFRRTWIDNGWDAAFAAGRNPGELQHWLRDYDPNGTAGKWEGKEKRGLRSARAELEDV